MSYLPRHATVTQACEWLESQTNEPWALPRLLENGLMPWFWLDYTPGWPDVFGERHEGYLAPMVFTGDTLRLEADASAALVTMTRTHTGTPMKLAPGMRVALEDLRFKREDIQALADTFMPSDGGASDEPDEVEGSRDEPEEKNPSSWQVQARAIADELDALDAACGAYDSVTNISDRVAAEMRRREIKGPRGWVSGATVRREALQGCRWRRKR